MAKMTHADAWEYMNNLLAELKAHHEEVAEFNKRKKEIDKAQFALTEKRNTMIASIQQDIEIGVYLLDDGKILEVAKGGVMASTGTKV